MKLNIPSQTILYFILIFVGASGFFFTMFLPQPAGFYAFILAVSLGGFGVAFNIWHTKSNKKDLVCPTGSNCNVVVNSKYSKFFGIPLEYLGMLYFLVIFVSYVALIVQPQLTDNQMIITAVALSSIGAALFSCYLLFVQAALLRAWCIWCILAAFLSLTVFFISLISLPGWTDFLANFQNTFEMLQFLGYALGLGSLTSAAFLFFNNFLKDRNIDDVEFDTLKGFSELIWFGFGMVLMTQFAHFVINPELAQSGTFVISIISLIVAAFAGAIMMVILSPFLTYIPFKENPERKTWLTGLRKPVFITGAIGLSSWYFTFMTHFIEEYNFLSLFSAYIITIAVAVIGALFMEQAISEEKSEPAEVTDQTE